MENETSFYEYIWREDLWFPVGVNGETYGWKDLESKPDSNEHYPQASDLHFGILLGVLMVVFRHFLERLIVIPLGYKLGIPEKKAVHVEPYPILEAVYEKHRQKVNEETCMRVSKQLDVPVRQVQAWFRRRSKQDRPSAISKFCNNSWHLLYYSSIFIYGLCVLWTKPWLWKTSECWTNWPHQPISPDLYWYYVIEFAFYWSLVITVFTDHKRKDFSEMIVHHFVTITLIYFSWVVNWVRLGSLVLLLHDASDPWLALSKMGIYLKKESLKYFAFVMFATVWFTSRLIYFPFWILNNTVVELHLFFSKPGLIHCICNVFQFLLLILNLMWSYRLYKMVYSTLAGGKAKDSRSDTEDDDEEETAAELINFDKNGFSREDTSDEKNHNHVLNGRKIKP